MLPIIKVPPQTQIAVIGDIHEHSQQFEELLAKIQPSPQRWVVSVGDIYDKGFGPEAAEKICAALENLSQQRIGYAVRGNHELKLLRKIQRRELSSSPGLAWMRTQPLSLCFEFSTGSKLTVLHGGVTPSHTWDDLSSNVEIAYIRTVDDLGKMVRLVWTAENGQQVLKAEKSGQLWHYSYDGRFGYLATGHNAQADGVAKFYNHSCNLDSSVYSTGILTAQIFTEQGRGELLTVTGSARKPDLAKIQV